MLSGGGSIYLLVIQEYQAGGTRLLVIQGHVPLVLMPERNVEGFHQLVGMQLMYLHKIPTGYHCPILQHVAGNSKGTQGECEV